MNNAVICGRIIDNPEIKEVDDQKQSTITIAVSRAYKNADGEYETDFIPCVLYNGIAKNTCEYLKKGDVVGIKGRLQSIKSDNGYNVELVAEKVTFLSSKVDKRNEEEN